MNDEEKKQLSEALRRVQAGMEPYEEARSYVQKAGQAQDRQFIGPLKGIVGQFSKADRNVIVFDALHAQADLGERADYFLQLARNHAADKMAAYYAILILAREPNDGHLPALNRIREESTDNHVRGAVDIARFVAYQDQQLQKLDTVEEKTDFLIEHLRNGWNPIEIDEYGPRGNLGSLAVWSQNRLRALSQAHPAPVAQKVFDMAPDAAPTSPEADYKAYVRRFLAPAAAAELTDLETRGGAQPEQSE